jgi:LacI family transcriptional regulator
MEMIHMPTIKDVARVSGLSVGTVSRYLNGSKLKKENMEKIEKAIRDLGYKVNPMARALKTNQTYTIGALVPSMTDVFSNQVIEGIDSTLARMDYSLIISSSRNSVDIEKKKLEFLKEKRVDGIILMPVSNEGSHVAEIIKEGMPLVLIDRLLEGVDCDAVVSDNINGAYRAVEYLINKGHRRIGIISGPSNIFTARERFNGYVRALNDYKIPLDESLIVYGKYEKGGGLEGIKKLLSMEDGPTAVFATNYETTVTSVKYMLENGIKIGEDVSFYGFDNSDIFRLLKPSITTVTQPMHEIGKEAMEILDKRITGNYDFYPLIKRLKTKPVEGNSVKSLIK